MRSWGKEMVVERFSRKQRVKKESDSGREREKERGAASLSLCAKNNLK